MILPPKRPKGGKIIQIKKRTFTKSDPNYHEPLNYKRQRKECQTNKTYAEDSLALTLIREFDFLDDHSQQRIINIVQRELTQDKELFFKSIKRQISQVQKKALQFYENGNQIELINLFNSVSPLTVIYLNIEISLTNTNLTEEGNTLSYTLLPYLNKWLDYTFITQKEQFILTRFLHSLSQHIKDNKIDFDKGFTLYALNLDAKVLQTLIDNNINNKNSLIDGLQYQGFCKESSELISNYPQQLLWPDLLQHFQGKQSTQIFGTLKILSKLRIFKDPTQSVKCLDKIFAQRKILLTYLNDQENIPISVEDLILVLENIKLLETKAIENLFQKDPSQWKLYSLKIINMEDISEKIVNQDKIQEIYNSFLQGIENPVPVNEMLSLSQELASNCEQYNHNYYQCTIASILASRKDMFLIVVIPTGSGKTWIQALLSKYFCKNGQKVHIIEPNQQLVNQTSEKIGPAHYDISVSQPSWMYEHIKKEEVLILDEYDEIISKYPYMIINNQLFGLWNLTHKRVLAFSATSNGALEKFVNNTVGQPQILRFQSEFELQNGISPITLGNIFACGSELKMLEKFKEDLEKYYEQKPLIVVASQQQQSELQKYMEKKKFKFVCGVNDQHIIEILDWDYGILVINPEEGRGIDTKFKKDSMVLIISEISNELQYQQLIGRSSRQRRLCDGALYLTTSENYKQVQNRLKKQNFALYQSLEKLLKLCEARYTNQNLIEILKKSINNGKLIYSIEELKSIMKNKQFQTLIKELQL